MTLEEIKQAFSTMDKAIDDMRTIDEMYPIDISPGAVDTDKSILRKRDKIKQRYRDSVGIVRGNSEEWARLLILVVEAAMALVDTLYENDITADNEVGIWLKETRKALKPLISDDRPAAE